MKARKIFCLGIALSFLSLAQFAVAEVTIERLDSITYTNNVGDEVKKEKIQYTEDGLILSHVTFNISTSDTIAITYTYEDGLLTEKLTETDGLHIHSKAKEEYTYDANGYLNQTVLTADYGWGTGWGNISKTTTKLNAQGLLEENVMYNWDSYTDPENPDWAIDTKKVYEYDAQDRVEQVEIYDLTGLSAKETYTFSEDNGEVKRTGTGITYIDPETFETGETAYDAWKDEQISDEDGDIIFYERYIYSMVFDEMWMPAGFEWVGDTKYIVKKTAGFFGSIITNTERYAWDSANKEWSQNSSTEESLTSNQRWITEYIKNPEYDAENPESELWISSKRTIYGLSENVIVSKSVFDVSGLYASLIEEELYTLNTKVTLDQIHAPATLAGDPYFFTHKPIFVIKNIFAEGTHTTDRVDYHYNSPRVNIPTVKTVNHNAYFSGNTLVVETPNAEKISIYSVTGGLISTINKAEGKANITIALTKGVYIVSGATGWNIKIIK